MDVDSDVAVAPATEAVEPHEAGVARSNSGEEDKGLLLFEVGEKNFGGNRWPRQETLALLKIRSDMDMVFRDATHKAPLWEEVSRKLGELGFNRTPKKCREKFENVYKYHKRTKGRNGKSDNSKKGYKFSDELEALDHIHHHNHISFQSTHHHPPSLSLQLPLPPIPRPMTPPPFSKIINPTVPLNMNTTSTSSLPPKSSNPLSNVPNMAGVNGMFSSSTSSSTASEEDPFRRKRRKKRKWSDFFVRLTKEVIEKQERLQLKFLETLERIENQRKLREEAWRMKEMSRVNQEHEILVQEMTKAAAKDAAVVAILQKIAPPSPSTSLSPSPNSPLLQPPPPPPHKGENNGETTTVIATHLSMEAQNGENNRKVTTTIESPSRWPKAEIEALIRLRTDMEMKYQENGAKGLLWEEISSAMRGIGYNRSSKRCKEKWENINKYFKKVKDSNKKRPEDSKTCPYYHQLDALYKEKEKNMSFDINSQMEPLMVEPEQQWPPPPLMGNLQRINGEEEDGGSSSTDVED